MIRFIRDAQPPNTQFKQGMVRDLGSVLNASFIASGDAVDAVEPDRAFPPAQRLLPAGVAAESPVPALTGTEVLQTRGVVSQDGILPRADTLFAVEKVQMTASGSPCAAPCLLHRIRCLVGASIALVVYDNPFGTSGTQLYSGTLSAGEEAVISGAPVRAINGPRGVFTGTATFEYHVSQEV